MIDETAASGIIQVFGAAVDSIIHGNTGRDWITGNSAWDIITGGGADDILSGGGAADRLSGGAGGDVLNGGSGGDRLTGNAGTDTLAGGSGKDIFVFTPAEDSAVGAARDVITDFTVNTDPFKPLAFNGRIAVAAIDASSSATGAQLFSYIGTGAFSAEGQIRAEQQGAGTLIQFNISGTDSVPEMEILLANFDATTLTSADFLF